MVHGDDPCLLPDGTDAYAYAKELRRFKMIKRTEGVSSTDIVGRMLMCTRDNARFRQVCARAREMPLFQSQCQFCPVKWMSARTGCLCMPRSCFKMIKRTEGVSSTDNVGRMLISTRDIACFRQVCV